MDGWDYFASLNVCVRRMDVVGLLKNKCDVQVPIPEHMDLYHLHDEAEPSDMSALDAVVDWIREELKKLEELEEHLLETVGPEDERLMALYERMEALDPSTFEVMMASALSASEGCSLGKRSPTKHRRGVFVYECVSAGVHL
jgi:ATP-binding cassette subfamily F protein 2